MWKQLLRPPGGVRGLPTSSWEQVVIWASPGGSQALRTKEQVVEGKHGLWSQPGFEFRRRPHPGVTGAHFTPPSLRFPICKPTLLRVVTRVA